VLIDPASATLVASLVAALVATLTLIANLRMFRLTREEFSKSDAARAEFQAQLNSLEKIQLERRAHINAQLSEFTTRSMRY
jgi:hypothetical protein